MNEIAILTLLVLTGLVLIAVDFYLPGFILGSVGVVLLIVALFVCKANHGWPVTMGLLIVEVAAGVTAGYLSIKYFPQTGVGQKMILAADQTNQRAHPVPVDLVGREGRAHTVLRPAGTALLDGKRWDVLAESGMIEAGTPIKVVSIKDNNIIVRKI